MGGVADSQTGQKPLKLPFLTRISPFVFPDLKDLGKFSPKKEFFWPRVKTALRPSALRLAENGKKRPIHGKWGVFLPKNRPLGKKRPIYRE